MSLVSDKLMKELLTKRAMVTGVAELLDIGHPALSKVLSVRAELSVELALSIEFAFGISADGLLLLALKEQIATARARR
jgi:plasmid maintenance system antidote protein VapI